MANLIITNGDNSTDNEKQIYDQIFEQKNLMTLIDTEQAGFVLTLRQFVAIHELYERFAALTFTDGEAALTVSVADAQFAKGLINTGLTGGIDGGIIDGVLAKLDAIINP